jgi:hypothetical protein
MRGPDLSGPFAFWARPARCGPARRGRRVAARRWRGRRVAVRLVADGAWRPGDGGAGASRRGDGGAGEPAPPQRRQATCRREECSAPAPAPAGTLGPLRATMAAPLPRPVGHRPRPPGSSPEVGVSGSRGSSMPVETAVDAGPDLASPVGASAGKRGFVMSQADRCDRPRGMAPDRQITAVAGFGRRRAEPKCRYGSA